MESIAAKRVRSSKRLRGCLAALASASLLGVALLPATAGAETEAESLYGPSMSLAFVGHSAKLVGGGAVVSVKCRGSRSGSCSGTVSLRLGSATHKVPFSIAGGARQRVLVPLGDDGEGSHRHRVHAVARTVQPLGSCRKSERVLHLR